MLSYKQIKKFLPLLLWVSIYCSGANTERFRPKTVHELIMDILIANTNGENDVIDLGGCTFRITQVNNELEQTGPNGLPIIQPDIKVATPHSLTIQNGTIEMSLLSGILARHFFVLPKASLFLEHVTLKFGNATTSEGGILRNDNGGLGGSILNLGFLSLNGVSMLNNTASSGGAIANAGTLSIGNSTFAYNNTIGSDSSSGGAILNGGIITKIYNSTFAYNSALISGGAISNIAVINTMTNNTIALNTAAVSGGGIDNDFAADNTIFISNIVAANTAPSGFDISDPSNHINNKTYNLVGIAGPGSGNTITSSGNNLVGTTLSPLDPVLAPLQNNGGQILTFALLPTSPALEAGYNPLALLFDQRGHGYRRKSGSATDIGAFEYQFCEHE